MDKLTNLFTKIFFTVACILFILYFVDRLFYRFGWDLLWISITPDRLIELTILALVFVITLLLIQIREALKK